MNLSGKGAVMSKKKVRNPLIKRIPKELIGDWKKYLVVFLFLVLTIGFVSGMYVANESMLKSAADGVKEYKQEDGHFELKKQADDALLSAIETGEKGRATRPNIKLGICGEHGGDPSSVEFCHNAGLTYVSCSPFRVPIARLAAAQAAIKNRNN